MLGAGDVTPEQIQAALDLLESLQPLCPPDISPDVFNRAVAMAWAKDNHDNQVAVLNIFTAYMGRLEKRLDEFMEIQAQQAAQRALMIETEQMLVAEVQKLTELVGRNTLAEWNARRAELREKEQTLIDLGYKKPNTK